MTNFVDLLRRAGEDAGRGALWGFESQDLDCTLVAWNKGEGVDTSTNDEVDVLMLVIEGRALVVDAGKERQLMQGQLLVIAKGTPRRIEALSERLVYLNVHKRRRPMTLKPIAAYPGRK